MVHKENHPSVVAEPATPQPEVLPAEIEKRNKRAVRDAHVDPRFRGEIEEIRKFLGRNLLD